MMPSAAGWSARVLVVADRPGLALAYSELLAARGMPTMATDVAAAPAVSERWLVVLVAEHWTPLATITLERLRAMEHEAFVLCPEAVDPAVALAMLEQGASEAYPDDDLGLQALVLKLRRRLGQPTARPMLIGAERLACASSRTVGSLLGATLSPQEIPSCGLRVNTVQLGEASG